ncbi:unnamed protein product [Euphydryas editha]|uniref:Uncharacterized protein n=1 Tax=Euphydryas editha TaxID=104508 RepID=A0AAU9TIK3_EUPED|nr:unnamed protein product [Euphydryas editha]
MQKYRKKLKENKENYETHLLKERERDKKRRDAKKASADAEEIEKRRKRDRERQRALRLKKKNEILYLPTQSTSSPIGTYKSKRSFKKAITKIKRSLPASPSKRVAVLKEIAIEVFPISARRLLYPKEKTSASLSKETVAQIEAFYQRDDISRAAPGIKDYKSVKDPTTGERQRLQKRHLVMSIGECYRLFIEEYPTLKVGKTKFYATRPSHVRPVSEIPHDVCVCVYHANFSFLIETASHTFASFPPSAKKLLEEVCCNIESEECMTNKCTQCDGVTDIMPLIFDRDAIISWNQWKEHEGRLQVQLETGTVADFIKLFEAQLKKFKTHWFVKNGQSKHFKEIRESISEDEAVLQVDFAENFAIISQDEIQGAHWRHQQATIFTGCAWVREGVIESRSYAIISEDLSHNKVCVWVFIKMIIKELTTYKKIKVVHIFSDGCAAQFKSRYNLYNICTAPEDFGVDITWSFFPTSHGKGAVDGIGAVVKRTLWISVKAREIILNTPRDCYEHLKKKGSGTVQIFYQSNEDIKEHQPLLEIRWEGLKPIRNLHGKHYFQKSHESTNCIKGGRTVSSKMEETCLKILRQDTHLRYSDIYTDSASDLE